MTNKVEFTANEINSLPRANEYYSNNYNGQNLQVVKNDLQNSPKHDEFKNSQNKKKKIISITSVIGGIILALGILCYTKGKGADGAKKTFGERMADGWNKLTHINTKANDKKTTNTNQETKSSTKTKTKPKEETPSKIEHKAGGKPIVSRASEITITPTPVAETTEAAEVSNKGQAYIFKDKHGNAQTYYEYDILKCGEVDPATGWRVDTSLSITDSEKGIVSISKSYYNESGDDVYKNVCTYPNSVVIKEEITYYPQKECKQNDNRVKSWVTYDKFGNLEVEEYFDKKDWLRRVYHNNDGSINNIEKNYYRLVINAITDFAQKQYSRVRARISQHQ